MHLVLLTFGEAAYYHSRALFALLTFLRSPLIKNASIYTDVPEFSVYANKIRASAYRQSAKHNSANGKAKRNFFGG